MSTSISSSDSASGQPRHERSAVTRSRAITRRSPAAAGYFVLVLPVGGDGTIPVFPALPDPGTLADGTSMASVRAARKISRRPWKEIGDGKHWPGGMAIGSVAGSEALAPIADHAAGKSTHRGPRRLHRLRRARGPLSESLPTHQCCILQFHRGRLLAWATEPADPDLEYGRSHPVRRGDLCLLAALPGHSPRPPCRVVRRRHQRCRVHGGLW